jgi:dTDP-4-dehydrorhamnose reductase
MIHLVFGASGQVGVLLYAQLRQQSICLGTCHNHPSPGLEPVDLCDHPAVSRLLREVRPDVCYLPAGWTHVDRAEEQAGQCFAVNALSVNCVASQLARQGGMLVLFSTDHVFPDGERAWAEDDPVEPMNVYAKSKAEAERQARDILPDRHLILRTSWVFGPESQEKNFLFRVQNTLRSGRPMVVSNDQYGQPTYGPDLARTAIDLVSLGARGTYHVVGPRSLSKFAWAQTIARAMHLPTELIFGLPTSDLEMGAPRPLRITLARGKMLRRLGRDPIRPPGDALNDFLAREGESTLPLKVGACAINLSA